MGIVIQKKRVRKQGLSLFSHSLFVLYDFYRRLAKVQRGLRAGVVLGRMADLGLA